MLPCYAQEPVLAEGRSISISRTRTVSWMFVPYFCLAKYSSLTVRPSSHPIRTLMQTRSSLIQKERDLQQAVRLLPDPPPSDVCFHIAQVWFIVLDDCKRSLVNPVLMRTNIVKSTQNILFATINACLDRGWDRVFFFVGSVKISEHYISINSRLGPLVASCQ